MIGGSEERQWKNSGRHSHFPHLGNGCRGSPWQLHHIISVLDWHITNYRSHHVSIDLKSHSRKVIFNTYNRFYF